MMRIAVLLSGASVLAMTTAARADPISLISTLVINSIIGTAGISFGTAQVIASVVAYATVASAAIGVTLLTSSRGGRGQQIDPGKFKNTFSESEASEIRSVGRTKLGGLKAFGNTTGTTIYRLVWHCKGPVDADEEYFLGGRPVVVESDGAVSSPPYVKPDGSWVYVKTKIGDGTETAWTELVSAFPTLWTAAHRARGACQSLVQYVSPGLGTTKFTQLYQGGAPDLETVGRRELIYDCRLDGTNGGTGTHRFGDISTWEWSDNGISCAIHIMRSDESLTVDDFEWSLNTDQSDLADAAITTKTGTTPRARTWGVWPSENPRGDTMRDVLDSIGAAVRTTDEGKIWIELLEDAREPEIAFTAIDIIDLSWRSGPEAPERPNVCRVKYYSAERGYAMHEIDMSGIAWARIDDEVSRYGEKPYEVVLPFCPDASIAQRIARRLFSLARADHGVLVTNWVGVAAWGLLTASIELPDMDETIVAAIDAPEVDDRNGTVEIPFTVVPDLTPWDPETDEAAAPEQLADLSYVGDVPQPAAPTRAVIAADSASTVQVRVAFEDLGAYAIVEANYRGYSGSNPSAWQSMTEDDAWAYAPVDLEGQRADFRVRVFDADDEGSPFSDILAVSSLDYDETPPGNISGAAQSAHCDDINVSTYEVYRRSDSGGPPVGEFSLIVSETYVLPYEVVTWTPSGPPMSGIRYVEDKVRFYNSTGQYDELINSYIVSA